MVGVPVLHQMAPMGWGLIGKEGLGQMLMDDWVSPDAEVRGTSRERQTQLVTPDPELSLHSLIQVMYKPDVATEKNSYNISGRRSTQVLSLPKGNSTTMEKYSIPSESCEFQIYLSEGISSEIPI